MRIATLGRKLPDKRTFYIPFKSEYSLLDYDIIIFDTSEIFSEYGRGSQYRAYRKLDSNDSARILKDRKRRKNEIIELANIGKTLIIFCPVPDKCYIDTGELLETIGLVKYIHINSFLPPGLQNKTTEASGHEIVFNGDDIFRSFWNKIKGIVYYKAYFNTSVGSPFLFIKGTKKPVGSWFQFKKGNIVFTPHLANRYYFKTVREYKNATETFISAVIGLVNDLKSIAGEYSLSEWANIYFLPGEKELTDKIHKKESWLQKFLNSIDNLKKERGNIRKYKLLLCGKGPVLKKQVISVLNEIGLKAKEGPKGRDDIIMEYEGKIGLGEIKGKSKSAAEKDAAQLEKWVSEYLSNNGIKAKGFLIVNAFCETPLNKRKQPAFPDQMLPYCINREHCLITTVQLLNILFYIKRNPQKRSGIITQLFKTIGIYKDYSNYEDYLEISQSPDYSKAKIKE